MQEGRCQLNTQEQQEFSINKLEEEPLDHRFDRFGNLILNGSKDHRIWFRDEIGEGTVEIVKEVESYKAYYKKNYYNWII